ncbi:hypothetical protein [Kineococcus sp. NUM-3379]
MHAELAAPGRGRVALGSPLPPGTRRGLTVVTAVLVAVCAAALVHVWRAGQPAVVLTAALAVAVWVELLAAVLLRERDRQRRAGVAAAARPSAAQPSASRRTWSARRSSSRRR